MRDQNIRNKFKDGDLDIYQSVKALEKLINSVLNGKPGPAREAFEDVKEDLMRDFEPRDSDEFFTKISDPKAMAAVLHVYTTVTRSDPRSRAWTLTAQTYLNKLSPLC